MVKKEAYQAAATAANEAAQRGFDSGSITLHPQNKLLEEFLIRAKELLMAEQREKLEKAQKEGNGVGNDLCHLALLLAKGVQEIRQTPYRIWSPEQLMGVKWFGTTAVRIVRDNLWALFPPPPPSAEDEEEYQNYKAKEGTGKAAKKAGKRGAAAAGVARGSQAAQEGEELGSGAKKRKTKEKKDYVPDIGTANYAFLICLYKELKSGGAGFMSKNGLMDAAEASGLSRKSIMGNQANPGGFGSSRFQGGGPQMWYDGWSSVKTMLNRTPPLVHCWSNPKKVRLTPEGRALAARLYKDAVQRGTVQPIPGVDPDDDIDAVPDPADPLAAPPEGTAAARASPAAAGRGRGRGRGAGGRGRGRGRGAKSAGEAEALAMSDDEPGPLRPASLANAVGGGYLGGGSYLAGLAGMMPLPTGPPLGLAAASCTTGVTLMGTAGLTGGLPSATNAPGDALKGRAAGSANPFTALPSATSAPAPFTQDPIGRGLAGYRPPMGADPKAGTTGGPRMLPTRPIVFATELLSSDEEGRGLLPGRAHKAPEGPVALSSSWPALGPGPSRIPLEPLAGGGLSGGPSRGGGRIRLGAACKRRRWAGLDDSDDEGQLPGSDLPLPQPAADEDRRTTAAAAGPSGTLAAAPAAPGVGAPGASTKAPAPPVVHSLVEEEWEAWPEMGWDGGPYEREAPGAGPSGSQRSGGVGGGGPAATPSIEDGVAMMVEMGFTAMQAVKALSRTGGSLEAAIDLVSDGDEDDNTGPGARTAAPPQAAPRNLTSALDHASLPLHARAALARQQQQDQQPAAQPVQPPPSLASRPPMPPRPTETCPDRPPVPWPPAAAGGTRPSAPQTSSFAAAALDPFPGGSQDPPALSQLGRANSGGGAGQSSQQRQASGSQPQFWERGERSRSAAVQRGTWRLPLLQDCALTEALGEETDGQALRLPPLPVGQRFDAHYELLLVLDNREKFCQANKALTKDQLPAVAAQRLAQMGCSVEVRSLQQGDALWVARRRDASRAEYVLDFIVERKRVDDLWSSIQSKRYNQQKFWLVKSGLRHPVYLVEGDMDQMGTGTKACKTSAVRTEVCDGFIVMHTANHHETWRSYAQMTQALQRLYSSRSGTGVTAFEPAADRLPTFAEFCQRVSDSKRMTVGDAWAIMLTGVPGVGAEVAKAVCRQYPTAIALWRGYEQTMKGAAACGRDAVTAAQQLLATVPISLSRSVGPVASAKVYDVIFANGWLVV